MSETLTVAAWLRKTNGFHLKDDVRELARLGDGGELSIQASRHHHCQPRMDNAERYRCVEIGSDGVLEGPDGPGTLVANYLLELPRTAVFANVPLAVAERYVEARGGILVDSNPDVTGTVRSPGPRASKPYRHRSFW